MNKEIKKCCGRLPNGESWGHSGSCEDQTTNRIRAEKVAEHQTWIRENLWCKEHTLTNEDIINVINKLKEVSENDTKLREKRRLKDWSKMADFYKEVENSGLPLDEKIGLIYTIDMLAQGYYLVIGEYLHNLTSEYLQKLKVPQEVIDNIYKSEFLMNK